VAKWFFSHCEVVLLICSIFCLLHIEDVHYQEWTHLILSMLQFAVIVVWIIKMTNKDIDKEEKKTDKTQQISSFLQNSTFWS
jgi:hypothetical protein